MEPLEQEGIALVRRYRLALTLNPPLAAFLRKLATRLGWAEFLKVL